MKRIVLGSVLLLGASVFGFVSFLGFSREFALIWKARASSEWQVTQGRISEASAFFWRERKKFPGKGRARAGYVPHLRYKYTVSGREYVGYRLRFISDDPELFADEPKAAALVAPFHTGDPVRVYYEPTDPANSTLGHTYKLSISGIVSGLICAILALAFATGSVFQVLPSRNRPPSS